ncbi:hypothetical protein ACCO45_009890 [Purpureocillium lilacinum]|uniref:Uncharacterized protein n=2 Tax=Purpureocillium lilacinum TaxID=33203 RepID=A0ACC4DIJ7_PURLI
MSSPNAPHRSIVDKGVYTSITAVLHSIAEHSSTHGHRIVKLRSSNYRHGIATRYDLACHLRPMSQGNRSGAATAGPKCPFRAKAVREVQLGNKWRLTVQNPCHVHETDLANSHDHESDTPSFTYFPSRGTDEHLSAIVTEKSSQVDGRIRQLEDRVNCLEALVVSLRKRKRCLAHESSANDFNLSTSQ